MINSGIYMWRNKITGRVLVGQTNNFKRRKKEYLGSLRKNEYANRHFQRSFAKHGEKTFEFTILERVACFAFLTAYEQSYLDYYRTLSGGVYNQIGPTDAPFRGVKLSDEVKHQMSERMLGEKNPMYGKEVSAETRGKMSLAGKGRPKTEDHKKKIGLAQKGRKQSEEQLAKNPFNKNGQAHPAFGRKWTDEQRERFHNSNSGEKHHQYGKPLRAETKEKMSKIRSGRKQPKEVITKIADANRGQKRTDEQRARISDNSGTKKAVERINPVTSEVVIYRSLNSAKNDGFERHSVRAACQKIGKVYKGFLWKFADQMGRA